jgi:tRNA G18 (ribose-2'-O)-methylase SpoU
VIPVESPDDSRIVEYVGLRDHQLRQRRESPGGDLAGVFIAEGDVVVERGLAAGYRLRHVLVDATRRDPLPTLPDVPVYAAGRAVLERITGMGVHRGMLAAFDRRPVPDAFAVIKGARRVLVLEGINNPTNVGVIVRSAVAMGMDAMLLDPRCSDPLYRRASRVAMGEVFRFPYAFVDPLPDGLSPLRRARFTIVALTPASDAVDIGAVAPTDRMALVLGAEGHGLREPTMAAADVRARIPMHGGVDSLNVGAAAAVACYALKARG